MKSSLFYVERNDAVVSLRYGQYIENNHKVLSDTVCSHRDLYAGSLPLLSYYHLMSYKFLKLGLEPFFPLISPYLIYDITCII